MSTNIFSIASEIFLNQPQEPKSIQFILDEVDNNTIFELLVLFLMEGIFIKFSSEDLKNLDNLNEEQLYNKIYFKFREYFISLGFNIFLKITKFKPLNFRNFFTFFPDKKYNINLCTLYHLKNPDNIQEIFIEYNSLHKSENLKDYILIISTRIFLLEIKFNFFI